jgi:hypothetical protein
MCRDPVKFLRLGIAHPMQSGELIEESILAPILWSILVVLTFLSDKTVRYLYPWKLSWTSRSRGYS